MVQDKELIKKLKIIGYELRKDALIMTTKAKSGHPGGSLSIADLISCLYFHSMNFNKEKLNDKNRDRLILSKGHCVPIQYAALARLNIIPKDELNYLRRLNHMLQGHPDCIKTPGIEVNSGSLGQGFSQAIGIAIAAKIDHLDYKTYVILGDGEIQEGQTWEAAMSASHYKLNNLIGFLDNNKLQIDGEVKKIMDIEPIVEKYIAFGWDCFSIDGHNYEQILNAIERAKNAEKPTMIVLETIKGKGISFMENKVEWHGKALNEAELKIALEELDKIIEGIKNE